MSNVMIKNNTKFSDKEIFNFLAGYRYYLEKEIFAYNIGGNGYDTILVLNEELDVNSESVNVHYGTDIVRI